MLPATSISAMPMSKPPLPPKAAPPIMSSSTPTARRPTLSIRSHSMSAISRAKESVAIYTNDRASWFPPSANGPE